MALAGYLVRSFVTSYAQRSMLHALQLGLSVGCNDDDDNGVLLRLLKPVRVW